MKVKIYLVTEVTAGVPSTFQRRLMEAEVKVEGDGAAEVREFWALPRLCGESTAAMHAALARLREVVSSASGEGGASES